MSTLFNLRSQHKEKPIFNHPWDKTIKGIYSNKIKHAHNSIENPLYPNKDEKNRYPDHDCIKFTVIGDRVTKEFIYCVNLVKGLHKYRWKKFDVPIIRGVTTVEWPDVWHSLKLKYGGLAHDLQSRVAVLMNEKILGGEVELKELIETKYIYHLQLDYYNEAVSHFATYIRSCGRPCAYMHISIGGEHIGTMIFMLYSDLLPYTCDNFLRRCNDTKGGYSGTPIHRIVKDGWIQCGGFGLKSVDLDCENFIIPHDRRGVLCMANDGRHIDCSTQFFVLLQPAPWMARRYVAFGQLIEGEATLEKIEKVPTWYESPTSEIVIFKAGIFNMECHDIAINKNTNEYIHGHIEDLIALGDLLIESLIQRVFLEIELNLLEAMEKELLGEGEEVGEEVRAANIHATERFLRRKDDIEKQIQNLNQNMQNETVKRTVKTPESEHENNDFDVDEYQMDEASPYQHMSIVSASLIVKPEKPFYMPLTDVPYPGEVDSTYDLKKFLKGDYCLESDVDKDAHRKAGPPKLYPPEIFDVNYKVSQSESLQSLDSVDEREIRHYLRENVDHVSFAGGIVRSIAKGLGPYNLLDKDRKTDLIADDQLRCIRLAYADYKNREEYNRSRLANRFSRTVSLAGSDKVHAKINRRQTGYVRPEDYQENDSDDDDPHRKVRIATTEAHDTSNRIPRCPTGFVRMMNIDESDTDVSALAHDQRRHSHEHRHSSHTQRPSAMQRLYDKVEGGDEYGPTFKDLKQLSKAKQKNIMLKYSPNSRIRSEDSTNKLFLRPTIDEEPSYENILNLQHNNKNLARKISSDYVKTIDQIEHRFETSIRSNEYAKARPLMTVSAYQLKNQKYHEEMKKKLQVNTAVFPFELKMSSVRGIRLPGDSPLFSSTSTGIGVFVYTMEDKLT